MVTFIINPISLKDLATAIATCVGIYVAITGINAWKKQLRGKTDYELARKYLKAALKLRDAMKFVRNPFISIGEMESALKESGLEGKEYKAHEITNRAVYSIRWNKAREAWTNLESELLDAEVSWGKEAVNAQASLSSLAKELVIGLQHFLDGNIHDAVKAAKNDSLIYNSGAEDNFSKRAESAIEEIKNFLRPHLQ